MTRVVSRFFAVILEFWRFLPFNISFLFYFFLFTAYDDCTNDRSIDCGKKCIYIYIFFFLRACIFLLTFLANRVSGQIRSQAHSRAYGSIKWVSQFPMDDRGSWIVNFPARVINDSIQEENDSLLKWEMDCTWRLIISRARRLESVVPIYSSRSGGHRSIYRSLALSEHRPSSLRDAWSNLQVDVFIWILISFFRTLCILFNHTIETIERGFTNGNYIFQQIRLRTSETKRRILKKCNFSFVLVLISL